MLRLHKIKTFVYNIFALWLISTVLYVIYRHAKATIMEAHDHDDWNNVKLLHI